MTSFLLLQKNLIKITLLFHFDKEKWLWIDFNESKKFDFEVIVFHVMKEFFKEIWSTKDDIQSIMILNRLLTSTERNYWSIELETAELIWVIKKIKHLIQFFEKSIIIQTNHAAIIDICKQTLIINTNFVMRMNLRLIRISQFLSQFSNLEIRHKSRKYHLISNALSRLQSLNEENLLNNHAKLNELFVEYIKVIYVYNTIFIELNSEFRARIIEKYFRDETWKRIIRTIDENAALKENAAKLFFVRELTTMFRESDSYMTSNIESRSSKAVSSFNETQKISRSSKQVSLFNEIQKISRSSKSISRFNENQKKSISSNQNNKDLIYHVNKSIEEKRFCISSECVSNILVIVHDQDHSEFDVCFEIIIRFWYIKELIKTFRQYIRHCSQCLIIQIKRHRSWKNLQLIYSSSISFHTITMNFVLSLSKIKEKVNCVLSMIDKFTKSVMLISRKSTYTIENWTVQLLKKSQRRDWDISKMIISDKDKKFLSDLWRTLFEKLEIFLLYSTTYHSQTNDVSERTNHTLEIALRYYIQEFNDFILWITILWKFQTTFNNTRSIATKKISNELLYEITSNLLLNISSSNKTVDNHTQLRKEAQNVMDWV